MRPALHARARALNRLGVGQSIGGIAIGAVGTGIYSGFKLAGGDDFAALSLVKQADPTGAYFPSHRRQGRRAINGGANDYYWTADHTGHDDSNRGVPITASNDLLVNSASRVFLKTRLATAAEKSLAWTTTASTGPQRPQAAASFHSAGYMGVKWPCIVEAMVRIPTSANSAAGIWPAFWMEDMLPCWPNTGEWDFEWNDAEGLKNNFITGTTAGATNDSIAATVVATNNDGTDHLATMVATATTLQFYLDGVLVNTATRRPTDIVTGPMFWWLRNGVDLTPGIYGMNYSAAAWAGKSAVMECDYVRVWTQAAATDIGFKGVVQTINVSFAGSMNATLPSETALWGRTDLTEYLIVQPFEDLAPGMSQVSTVSNTGLWYGQSTIGTNYAGPTICAWNRATRAFTGSGWDGSGRMFAHLVAWDNTNGGLAGVARVVVNVGPRVTLAAQSWTQGVGLSVDVYAGCDAGMLTTDGTSKAKTITVTGMPAGTSYSDATGLITGTPTGTGSGNMTITVTNSLGQVSAPTAIAYTVAASSSAIAAPSGITSQTLIAHWDFNDATSISTTGSVINTIGQCSADAGLNSAFVLTSINSPTIVTRNSKTVGRLTATSSQYLKYAGTMGVNGQAVTLVAIYEPATVPGTGLGHGVVDIAALSVPLAANRQSIIGSPTSGWSHRKCDNSSVSSTAQTGGSITTGIRALIGRSPTGASTAAELNVDGAGSAIVAGSTSSGPTLTTGQTVLGVTIENGTPNSVRYADGYYSTVLVYAGASTMSDADAEAIAVWAAANYGTTNGA